MRQALGMTWIGNWKTAQGPQKPSAASTGYTALVPPQEDQL